MQKLWFLSLLFLFMACRSTSKPAYFAIPKEWMAPPSLHKGDSILYVAPAGYVDAGKKYMERSDSLLKSWGYVPVYPKNLFRKHFIFAGTDQERLEELQSALDRPDIKAIWCARGGYGSVRIINKLDFKKFKKHPKWLIGYSDITVLHVLLHKYGFQSVHAFMPISLTHHRPNRKAAINSFKKFLEGEHLHYEFKADSLNRGGKATGVVVGGNLSLLVSLLGSSYQLNPKGKILFLEDVGEYSYSYDKMLYALKNAGYFEHLKALIIGGTGTKDDDEFIGENIRQMILKHVKGKSYPVIFNFPAGHIVDNRVLIFGRKARLKAGKNKVIFDQ